MADTKIKYVSSQNLSYYDQKIKAYLEGKDNALKTNLEGQIGVVAGALDEEITRAKGAEGANASAAAAAQSAAEAAQAHSEALAAKVGTVPEGSTVMGIIKNIQESAYDDTELRGLISGLDTNKADKTQVATDISTAVKAEEDARKAADEGLAADIKTISDDYLKGADKTELEGKITANTNAIATLNGDGEGSVKKAVDDAINKFATDVTNDEVVNSYKELIDWAAEHGGDAAEMAEAIEANTKAIEDHAKINHDFAAADTALKSELEGKINAKADASALSSAVSTLEAADEAVASAAAADATSKANKALDDAKSYANTELGKDRARLDALELIDHEHSNKALLDTYDQTNANIKNAVDKAHEHTNKTVLDGIDAAKVANWNTSFTNNHTHANKTVLDGINEGLIANWNAAHTFTSNMEFVTTAEIDAMFA